MRRGRGSLYTLRNTFNDTTDGEFHDKHAAKKERDARNGGTPEELQAAGKRMKWVVTAGPGHWRGRHA